MKKIQKLFGILSVALLSCLAAVAQEVPSIPGTTPGGPIPVPRVDRQSWAMPLADMTSYAQQAIRHVSGYTQAKTALSSSQARWINFEFVSPRSDGVILAKDLNAALATNQFDLIIAQSETGFGGNINLADSAYGPLFEVGFWVDANAGEKGDLKINVTYYLVDKLGLPVPADLQFLKVSYQDASGQQTAYIYPENGRIMVPTNLGHIGTATARFSDGEEINFSLANGLPEAEKRVVFKVEGDFASTFTFQKGETYITLGLESWELNSQSEYRAIFEPRNGALSLYAATPQKVAQTVRLRSLPNGEWFGPFAIKPGEVLQIILPPQTQTLGVMEAVFTFVPEYYQSHASGGGMGMGAQ